MIKKALMFMEKFCVILVIMKIMKVISSESFHVYGIYSKVGPQSLSNYTIIVVNCMQPSLLLLEIKYFKYITKVSISELHIYNCVWKLTFSQSVHILIRKNIYIHQQIRIKFNTYCYKKQNVGTRYEKIFAKRRCLLSCMV